MRARRALLSFAFSSLVLAGVGIAGPARADGDADGARKHFEAGKKLRDDNDCTKAIPEFEKSLAAEKSIGAYYNLGFCQEQLGKRQEAYDAYRRGRDMASAKKDERLKELSGALAALLDFAPNIRLVLPQPLPPGFQLTVDGEVVPAELYQTETVVFTKTAASHDVRATAPGYDDTVVKVDTKELKPIAMTPSGGSPQGATSDTPPPVKTHWTGARWAGAGMFIGGIGIGSIGAIMAITYKIDVDATQKEADAAARRCTGSLDYAACNNLQPTTQKQRDDKAAFQSAATRNNDRDDLGRKQVPIMIALGVAGVLAAGIGVYLFLTNPPEPDEPPPTKKVAAAKAKANLKPVLLPILSPTMTGGTFALTF